MKRSILSALLIGSAATILYSRSKNGRRRNLLDKITNSDLIGRQAKRLRKLGMNKAFRRTISDMFRHGLMRRFVR
ncbi:MAG: hypothetical protein M0Z65_09670 [Firmicutes bacterium]|uniref:Uncharacterized protein n=1 Tax=Melghirimyces thermohalophilus TaxID=1236220 RepID=A0A1G6MZS3_9BACL|nr:hypothetical protein [Melghirimyces thermohalophilus]MDA8353430.1 hypothetical protein [Bacillota bacterium]SDC61063.1 hypothetical protein SAMN04488112_11171 [Melghirimyces thermohalophilus]